MTRGRHANHAWVITTENDAAADDPTFRAPRTGREILESILDSSGAQLSAHETRDRATFESVSIRQLANEYETLSAAASSTRWAAVLQREVTPGVENPFVASTAWDSLSAALREANARSLPIEQAIPALITVRAFQPGDDPAAVLHYRVEQWVEQQRGQRAPMIAGLIPHADLTAAEPDLRAALAEREAAILDRAAWLIDAAAADSTSWLQTIPLETQESHQEHLVVVAAYRDRHGIAAGDPRPLGGPPRSGGSIRADWRSARNAWKAVAPGDDRTTPETKPANLDAAAAQRLNGPPIS